MVGVIEAIARPSWQRLVFEGRREQTHECDAYVSHQEYRIVMGMKGACMLAMAALEVVIVAEIDVNMNLVQDILAAAVTLDYLLVAFAKGISSTIGMYFMVCVHQQRNSQVVPLHAFGVKFQNVCFGVMFVLGVYILPALFKVSGQDDMENMSRIYTMLWIGFHHIVWVGLGAS